MNNYSCFGLELLFLISRNITIRLHNHKIYDHTYLTCVCIQEITCLGEPIMLRNIFENFYFQKMKQKTYRDNISHELKSV